VLRYNELVTVIGRAYRRIRFTKVTQGTDMVFMTMIECFAAYY
jgi:hypothetical protein